MTTAYMCNVSGTPLHIKFFGLTHDVSAMEDRNKRGKVVMDWTRWTW